jgi:glycerol-3-phosphate dehydrogenase
MNIAIVGGGINGLTCAWKLAQAGHKVTLFERDKIMQATSCSSSKLLHGGLRYLEYGAFRLVREALAERERWFILAPHLAKPLPIIYPIFKDGNRSKYLVGLGIWLYKILSKNSSLPAPHWLKRNEFLKLIPALKPELLMGGYQFYDGQMDDYNLGLWVAERCKKLGVMVHEDAEVEKIDLSGNLQTAGGNTYLFDRVINVAGPWAEKLLQQSNLKSPVNLDLIRGSHLIVKRKCEQAYLLEIFNERRIFFVLPWQGKTLIGTTEVRQQLHEPIECASEEIDYLIKAYNYRMVDEINESDVESTFAGVRPLLSSTEDPLRVTREYAIRREGKLINVFGGKWTTAYALAEKVMLEVNLGVKHVL